MRWGVKRLRFERIVRCYPTSPYADVYIIMIYTYVLNKGSYSVLSPLNVLYLSIFRRYPRLLPRVRRARSAGM